MANAHEVAEDLWPGRSRLVGVAPGLVFCNLCAILVCEEAARSGETFLGDGIAHSLAMPFVSPDNHLS